MLFSKQNYIVLFQKLSLEGKKTKRPVAFALVLIVFSAFPFLGLQSSYGSTSDTWTSKALLPRDGEGLGVVAVDGRIHAIGGWTLSEIYSPASDTWTNMTPMPISRTQFGISEYKNKIYVIGGHDDISVIATPEMNYEFDMVTGANEVYNPATDTWETKASMPTPRNYLDANTVGDRIFLIGGLSQQKLEYPKTEHISNITEVYDPTTDMWATMAPIPTAVWGYASAVVNGKIYIISGWKGDSSASHSGVGSALSSEVQIFDPETNSWTHGRPIPTPVALAAAGATTGVYAPKRIYVIGGSPAVTAPGQGGTNATQVYNPETNSWSIGAPMPTARYNLGVAVVDDILFAVGGASFSLTAVNEQYTPFGYGTVGSPSPSPSVPELTSAVLVVVVVISSGAMVVLKKRLNRRVWGAGSLRGESADS
jgi:hypothetical protein